MVPQHPPRHGLRLATKREALVWLTLVGLVACSPGGPSAARAGWRAESLSLEAVAPSADPGDRPLRARAMDAEEQAGALYSAGRYKEALAAQQRSVQIHRDLVARDPSQSLQLAASLHNLGVVFIRLGRKEEAIAPTEESVALYRAAPALSPAGASGTLANTEGGLPVMELMERPLRNLVLLYFETNRPQDALPMADALVRLHQSSSVHDPVALAERMDVLNLRANLQVSLFHPQEALRDLETAVGLGRELIRRVPGNVAVAYSMAGSLVNLSQVAALLGRPSEALQPALEAEALLRKVAQAHPQMMGDWGKSLSRLGQAYLQVGSPAKAKGPLQESIALLRLLAHAGPAETLAVEVGGYEDDLAHALEILAVVQQQLGHPQDARLAAEEALAIYTTLAHGDPRYRKDVERTRSWLTASPSPHP